MKSAKNALTPGSAASDLGLGLGDQLQDQMKNEVLERKKKAAQMAAAAQQQGAYNPAGLSQAAKSLGLSPGMAQ